MPLKRAMDRAEKEETEIANDALGRFGIAPELDQELCYLLVNNTIDGSITKTILRAAEGKGKPGLEQWRLLHRDAMPKGGAQETLIRQSLSKPEKAGSYEDLRRKLIQWDADLAEEERKSGTGKILTVAEKAMALL